MPRVIRAGNGHKEEKTNSLQSELPIPQAKQQWRCWSCQLQSNLAVFLLGKVISPVCPFDSLPNFDLMNWLSLQEGIPEPQARFSHSATSNSNSNYQPLCSTTASSDWSKKLTAMPATQLSLQKYVISETGEWEVPRTEKQWDGLMLTSETLLCSLPKGLSWVGDSSFGEQKQCHMIWFAVIHGFWGQCTRSSKYAKISGRQRVHGEPVAWNVCA